MRIITGKAVSRRTLLRGAGAALALPLLDAMVPASIFGRVANGRVHRFQTFYIPNGMAMEYWTPKGEGADFEFSPVLEPLTPYRDQLLVISGIDASWNQAHVGASGSFLTGIPQGPRGRDITALENEVSMDQILAREFASETQVASLELGMDIPPSSGRCSGGLNCAYTNTLSWRTASQPLPVEYNPRIVFERLFGDVGSTDQGARARRLTQQSSLLDFVLEDLAGLRRQLGPSDQSRLDEFSESVRDVERRIQLAERQIDIELPDIAQPAGAPSDFDEHVGLLLDLQALALQADLTRVITFMMGAELSGRSYPQIGVSEAHHPLSHHGNRPDLVAHMSKINRYHTELFAGYLKRLRDTPDGDYTLLDNTTILYGSGISNSHQHSGVDLPLLLAGGGAGQLRGGRHIRYTHQPALPNLLVTLMDKLNVPVDRIGSSTGGLPIDTVSGLG